MLRSSLSTKLPFLQNYFKKSTSQCALSTLSAAVQNSKIVEEFVRAGSLDAHVNIKSEMGLYVQSCNLLKYSDGAHLHGRLYSNASEKPNEACMEIIMNPDNLKIEVNILKRNCAKDAFCHLELPYFVDLNIEASGSVEVAGLFCNNLLIQSENDVLIDDVRAQKIIQVCSKNGGICSKHMLQGGDIHLITANCHPIVIDSVTGNSFLATTDEGSISTNSVYVHNSKFVSNAGNLKLKNVHKHCEIEISGAATIQMEGTRAELNICGGDFALDLQLSHVLGNSNIVCNDNLSNIGISDKVEKMVNLDISAKSIILDKSLRTLDKFLNAEKTKLVRRINENNKDKLTVQGKCELFLNKNMWIDNLIRNIKRAKINKN